MKKLLLMINPELFQGEKSLKENQDYLKNIFDSVTSLVHATLLKEKNVIFEDKSKNCGLEIVHK